MFYNQRATPPMSLITRSASVSSNNIDISKLRKAKEERDKKENQGIRRNIEEMSSKNNKMCIT